MNHEGEGENTEKDGEFAFNRRRVTFRSEADGVKYFRSDFDEDPSVHWMVNSGHSDEKKQQSPECTDNKSGQKLSDSKRAQSQNTLSGVLRARSISLSPLPTPSLSPTAYRLSLAAKISEAMKRSDETRRFVDKLKKRMFHRTEYKQREAKPAAIEEEPTCSNLKPEIENGEKRQKRRMVSTEKTKVMMDQSLAPNMMPRVEDALKAHHFIRRRRSEAEHGRIVHKILVEQHKRIVKELSQNEHRNGVDNDSSVQQQAKESESS